MEFRTGQGYDVHRIGDGLKMWLCGVNIPGEKGFIAHSDGDVAIHALCDALLGALALGDIGHLFPDNDPKYSGIDSKLLLKEVYGRVQAAGWNLVNADITIALQSPKLAPFITEMRTCLASVLEVDAERISVKATTTEHLGFVGRQEGCAVWAVATLRNS